MREIRNKKGGHGSVDKKISPKEVSLVLHHATANMLYIAETYLEKKPKGI